jgi:hypothetical protein
MYDPCRRFFRPSQAFLLADGRVRGPVTGLFHGGGIWHRSLFDEARGYSHMGSGEDLDLERRFSSLMR